jgi:hypothetical protein
LFQRVPRALFLLKQQITFGCFNSINTAQKCKFPPKLNRDKPFVVTTNKASHNSLSDRHQLVQQMQMIGGGALGPQAAKAVRHVAAQNGVWSLGNFGGVPPKSAMQVGSMGAPASEPATSQARVETHDPLQTKIEEHDYRFVFNSCSVGMVSNFPSTARSIMCIGVTDQLEFHNRRRSHQWEELLSTATNCSVDYQAIQSKRCAR